MKCRRWMPALLPGCLFQLLVSLSCTSVPPASPPAPSPVPEAVIWEITPDEGYQDEQSYVTLEYASAEALRAAGAGEPDGPVPAGGRLTVHLGYRELEDANTAWFRFEVAEGPRTLLRLDGEQGVPNVKGLDDYWWNDVTLDLAAPITKEAQVKVYNRKYEVDYVFDLRKLVNRQHPPRVDSWGSLFYNRRS